MATPLQAVRLEEGPQGLGHLEVALLAEHEAVVRVRAERLVRRIKPLGEALDAGLRNVEVETAADDQPRHVRER